MALTTNSILLNYSGTSYPCSHLPVEVARQLPPNQRESYMDYGDGQDPIVVRVFMIESQWTALPTAIKTGVAADAVSFTFGGDGVDWSSSTAQASFTTAAIFTLLEKRIVLSAIVGTVYELIFVNDVYNYRFQYCANFGNTFNLLSADRTGFVDGTGTPVSSTADTYQQICDAWTTLGGFSTFGTLPSSPVAQPFNVSLGQQSPLLAMARILRPLSIRPVVQPWTGARSFLPLDYTDPGGEQTKLNGFSTTRGITGQSASILDQYPGFYAAYKVSVVFPDSVLGFQFPDVEGPYTNPVATPTTSNGLAENISVGDHFYFATATPAYTQNLPAIASERATAYFNRVNIGPFTYVFAGLINIPIGKVIRRVRLAVDMVAGYSTTAWMHGQWDRLREGIDQRLLGRFQTTSFPDINSGNSSAIFPRDDGTVDVVATPGISLKYGVVASAWSYGQDVYSITPDGSTGTVNVSIYWDLTNQPQYAPYTVGAHVAYLPHGSSVPGSSAVGQLVGMRQIPICAQRYMVLQGQGASSVTTVTGLLFDWVRAH